MLLSHSRLPLNLLFCAAWTASTVHADTPPPPGGDAQAKIGDVVYHKDFRQGFDGWVSANPQCIKTDSVNGLEVSAIGAGESGAIGNRDVLGVVDTSKSSTFVATTGLPLMRCKGYELELALSVKAEGVPAPPVPWEGVRIVINYLASTGVYSHSYNGLDGTFDWREVRYRFRIPADAQDLSIDLGLISPAGKAWFDQVTMTVVDIPLAMKTPPPGPVYKGHDLPRLRGFGSGGIHDPRTKANEDSFKEIANDWNANVIKLWFNPSRDLAKVDAELAEWLAGVDRGVELARENQAYLILHAGEGNWVDGSQSLLYVDPAYADKLTAMWETMATRYKGEKAIWAFELLNETSMRKPPSPGCTDYEGLMERVAKAVNAIDPDRAMIVQCEMWWGTRAFERLRPIQANNIIYAAHIYSPFPVSHQGVGEFLGGATSWKGYAYPGTTDDGIKWDKDTLRRELQPVLDFQKAYNVHIIVSEFSCIRWALGESRTKLLTDMIDLYEEYGWDWTYHAYPEWHGWNPTLGDDPWVETRPATPPSAEVLLRTWFKKNQRPEWTK